MLFLDKFMSTLILPLILINNSKDMCLFASSMQKSTYYQNSISAPSNWEKSIYSINKYEFRHSFTNLISIFFGLNISWLIFLIYCWRTVYAYPIQILGRQRDSPRVHGAHRYPHQNAKRQGQYWEVLKFSWLMYDYSFVFSWGVRISLRILGILDSYLLERPLQKRVPIALSFPRTRMVCRGW